MSSNETMFALYRFVLALVSLVEVTQFNIEIIKGTFKLFFLFIISEDLIYIITIILGRSLLVFESDSYFHTKEVSCSGKGFSLTFKVPFIFECMIS